MPCAAPGLFPTAHRPHAPLLRLRGGGSAPSKQGGGPSRRGAGRAFAGAERTEPAVAGAAGAQGAERSLTARPPKAPPPPPRSAGAEGGRAERAQGQRAEVRLQGGGHLATSGKEGAGPERAGAAEAAKGGEKGSAAGADVKVIAGKEDAQEAALDVANEREGLRADGSESGRDSSALKETVGGEVNEALEVAGQPQSSAVVEAHSPDQQSGLASGVTTTGAMNEVHTSAAIHEEVKGVKALSEDEHEGRGSKYIQDEALWTALEAGNGATRILRASWLKEQNPDVFRLPKRNDSIGAHATIQVKELRDISRNSRCEHGALPVIALSHFWRTKEHPDPDGETLRLVIETLNNEWSEFERKGVVDVGVLIDWCALYQEPRETDEEKTLFQAGLKGINQWYAHQGTTVWLVTAGKDRHHGLGYHDKGWCSFEFALAMLIKPANTSSFKDWAQVLDLGKKGHEQFQFLRPSLSRPDAFFEGGEHGTKKYTNGADRDKVVAPKFRETMVEVMGSVQELNYGTLDWGVTGIQKLADVIPLCGQLTKLLVHGNGFGCEGMIVLTRALSMGALNNLENLVLADNKIGDEGMKSFAEALCMGALNNLESLDLNRNKIGHEGMKAFAEALSKGALNNLVNLDLSRNEIGHEGMKPFAEGISKGALNNLKNLDLFKSNIGDEGMKAFAEAISKGALNNLENLNLRYNKIGNKGMKAFSKALSMGALNNLENLDLVNNKIGDEGMMAFAEAISKGALNNLKDLVLYSNNIGDEGMKAFAEAISKGALKNLENLNLYSNNIGDEGMKAFAEAISKGALNNLKNKSL